MGAPRAPDAPVLLAHRPGHKEHKRLLEEVRPFLDSVGRSIDEILREVYG